MKMFSAGAFQRKPMQALKLTDEEAALYQRTKLITKRKGSGILPDIHILRLLGKGSNNKVFLASYKNREPDIIVRTPRVKSDTQRVGNATWEFRNTIIASNLGVAPLLYDAWYSRHSTPKQRAGLHLVAEYYPYDVHNLLVEEPQRVIPVASTLRAQAIEHMRHMANHGMLCYDLKPSNMVFSDENDVRVKFIDFGRDFCEWKPFTDENEYLERAPVLSLISNIARENCDSRMSAKTLYHELIYAVMIIILSSNIAYTLSQSSRASRCSASDKARLNFMAGAASELREYTRNSHVKLIMQVLRHTEVRETLRHYMGRRNSGTKRVFSFASFVKVPQ